MRLLRIAVLALLAPIAAWATPPNLAPSSNVVGGYGVPEFGIYCMDASNNAQVCSFGGGGSGGAVTQSTGSSSTPWWMEGLGTAGTPAGGVLTIQGISGGTTVPTLDSQSGTWTVGLSAGSNAIGSVTVSNFPGTQAVSAASLPLPSGAATAANQTSVLAPVAPATATATQSALIGCLSNTTLPAFTAGQQGAIPCDGSGRPYVTINTNVPAYLQAVSSGGMSVTRTINAASSAMATVIKSGSGMLFTVDACNNSGATVYFRIAASATFTAGTTTPQLGAVPIATASCYTLRTDIGLVFANGISFDVTTGSMADSDSTAISAANGVTVTIGWK